MDGNGSLGELARKSNQGQHGFMNSLDQNRPCSILVTTLWSRGSATLPVRSPGGGTRFCASSVERNGSLGELAPPAVWKSKQGGTRVHEQPWTKIDQARFWATRCPSILPGRRRLFHGGANSRKQAEMLMFSIISRGCAMAPLQAGGISPRLRRRFSGLRREGASDSFHPAGRGARPRQPKDPPATDTLTTI